MSIVGTKIKSVSTGENRDVRSRALQKRIKARWTAAGIVLLAVVLSPCIANASSILGGNGLLDYAGADLLEGWLGDGELEFTNIFTKAPGDDSLDFHAAADGMGRTFSLIEVVDGSGNTLDVIGGYNPQSWSLTGGWNDTLSDSERTAFVFNLTEPRLLRQKLGDGNSALGQYQTYNGSVYGPTFGGGHDIYVDRSLSQGYTNAWSYGTNGVYGRANSITGMTGDFRIGEIEVFTIAPDTTSAVVPVPAPAALALLGMGMVAAVRRRKMSLQA